MTLPQLIQLLRNSQASPETICNVMHVWKADPEKPPSRKEVLNYCCQVTGSDYIAAKSPDRRQEDVRARQLFIHYFTKFFPKLYTLTELGRYLNRDHTTIMHSRDSMNDLISVGDKSSVADLDALLKLLAGEEVAIERTAKYWKLRYTPIRKVIYDHKTGKKYNYVKDLAIDLGDWHNSPFKLLQKKFGILRFEWIDEN